MKSTKVLFLFLVFSLMLFLLSNLVLYLAEAPTSGKLFLVFSIYAEYIPCQESLCTFDVREVFNRVSVIVLVGGTFVLITNLIVQAVVRIWRPFKTLISFYIPIFIIPSPLLFSWWIITDVNVSSVFSSFMIFVYTSLAMMFVRSTLRRHTKINPNETGMCMHMCVVLVN